MIKIKKIKQKKINKPKMLPYARLTLGACKTLPKTSEYCCCIWFKTNHGLHLMTIVLFCLNFV